MEKNKDLVKRVKVFCDLEKIINYHPISSAYKTKTYYNDSKYSKIISVKPLLRKTQVEGTFKATFLFPDVLDYDPMDPHLNNMLVLVQNMIEIDWSYYNDYLADEQTRKEGILILEQLKSLFEVLEGVSSSDFQYGLVKKYIHTDKNGRKSKKSEAISDLNNWDECKQIIELLIASRQKKLNSPELAANFYTLIDHPTNLTTTLAALDIMQNSFRPFMAKKVFRTSVINALIDYMSTESGIDRGN